MKKERPEGGPLVLEGTAERARFAGKGVAPRRTGSGTAAGPGASPPVVPPDAGGNPEEFEAHLRSEVRTIDDVIQRNSNHCPRSKASGIVLILMGSDRYY
jgi:hypothetical protein